MTARQGIRLVRRDDAQADRPRNPGEKGGQGPGAGIGRLEIFQGQDDWRALRDPGQDAQDRLEHPRLAPFRLGPRCAGGQQVQRRETFGQRRQEASKLLGTGSGDTGQVGVRQPGHELTQSGRHRRIRVAGSAGSGQAADHDHRLRQAGDAKFGFIEQAAGPETGVGGQQQRRRIARRCRVQGGCQPGKLALATNEAFARET